MIISVEDIRNQVDCGNATDDQIRIKLEAIESVIRAYTGNNFQKPAIRFEGDSDGRNVYGDPQFFRVGDTVQISASGVNDGLYVVRAVAEDYIRLDRDLHITRFNRVTKIEYPPDVVQCAVDLYQWKQKMGDKVGIKSETLSRHSVTYEDSGTLYMGYPTGILYGLNMYRKARW